MRQRVEDAVQSLGGRVTIGDVSSRAGLTLGETERALNALAADSEGTLQVSAQRFLRGRPPFLGHAAFPWPMLQSTSYNVACNCFSGTAS